MGADADTAFLAQRLLAGRLPDFIRRGTRWTCWSPPSIPGNSGLDPGRRVRLLLANARGEMRPRVFTVCGVYGTGLQEFDAEYVFCGMHHLQQLSGWGITARLQVYGPGVVEDSDGPGYVQASRHGVGGAADVPVGRVDWRVVRGPHRVGRCWSCPTRGQRWRRAPSRTRRGFEWHGRPWHAAAAPSDWPVARMTGISGAWSCACGITDALWTLSDSLFFACAFCAGRP